jgi:hypothetical protein
MTQPIDRRRFLAGSAAAAAVVGAQGHAQAGALSDPRAEREFYELRRYHIESGEQQDLVLEHLEASLMPALGRSGLDRIGVFVPNDESEGHDVHVLLPFANLSLLGVLDDTLAADRAYQESARSFYERTDKEAAYARVESRMLQAFRGMPVIELPAQTKTGAQRIFEIRTYESRTADAARRKVEMFDKGEIQLMRDVGLAPVFYGATRIGHDVPNLTYMLCGDDRKVHAEHFQAFLARPEWERMKAITRYQGTVSKITNWFLKPVGFSQI